MNIGTTLGKIKKIIRRNRTKRLPQKVSNEREVVFLDSKKTNSAISNIIETFDKKHIWAFTSGQASNEFRGNPKYLFAYICKYRPDIYAYWVCVNEDLKEDVQKVSDHAFMLESDECQELLYNTGVFVAEQVKLSLPENLSNDVVYLNLWHGVGYKMVERQLKEGQLAKLLASKYIKLNDFYKNNQLMLTASDSNAEREKFCLGLDDNHIMRTGYPRCQYQRYFDELRTYNHEIRFHNDLNEDTRIIVYAPTYRKTKDPIFQLAIKDPEKLHECCVRNNYLFIFKIHSYLEGDTSYANLKARFKDYPNFLFWDNRDDFYEIMHKTDLAIFDYSSIFSDFLACGVRKFLRYDFDYEDYFSSGIAVEKYYKESTTGEIIKSFEDLLDRLDNYDDIETSEDVDRLMEQLWGYTGGKGDFDVIIENALAFKPTKSQERNLYSFDVFDTVFSRKVLEPEGVFYYVKEKMIEDGSFPKAISENYPNIRVETEGNVRYYKRVLAEEANSEWVEITFDEIFDHMQEVYLLNREQIDKLKKWELEAELDNVIPLSRQIAKIKKLLDKGEKVILISDMYLPKDHIRKMLIKADPIFEEIPLFLSNEYGVHKAYGDLYLKVYGSFEPYYDFSNWIHFGDNKKADVVQAKEFNIIPRRIMKPEFSEIEKAMVEKMGSYDSYLLAAMQARMRDSYSGDEYSFIIDYIAPFLVPYIDWVIRDAQRRDYRTLYFMSRDGYHMKRIADAIIDARKIDLKTSYIYGSRKTWRTPSFFDEIDEQFWAKNGNFERINNEEKLLKALKLDKLQFEKLFPEVSLSDIDYEEEDLIETPLMDTFRESEAYRDYMLKKSAEDRIIINEYFEQEIDKSEKFAFVDYYGSGYTQKCISRIWDNAVGGEGGIPFYFSRSLRFNEDGLTRHNFTTGYANPHVLMELFFEQIPYKSIAEYKREDGIIKPVKIDNSYDIGIFNAACEALPKFAAEYASLELSDTEQMSRSLNMFIHHYYLDNKDDPFFLRFFAPIEDSQTTYGDKEEFAPPYREEDVERMLKREILREDATLTHSYEMSYARSDDAVKDLYDAVYQVMPGEKPQGRIIPQKKLKQGQFFKKKCEQTEEMASIFRSNYYRAVKETEVSDMALFVANNVWNESSGLGELKKLIDESGAIKTDKLVMKGIQKPDSIYAACKKLASARYIIVDSPIDNISKICLRSETKQILVPAEMIHVYGKLFNAILPVRWEDRYIKTAKRNDISVIQVPSEHQLSEYIKTYSFINKIDEYILGNCNSDLFFNTNKEECRQQLEKVFPEAKGKKVILYAPAIRPVDDWDEWARLFDLRRLSKLIGDEYVVAVSYNKKKQKIDFRNRLNIPGFSKAISKGIGVRQLAIASDVIISDYREIFFESVLLRRPMFSCADDYKTRMKGVNVVPDDYKDYIFCPIVRSADELAEKLQQIDNYSFEKMDEFRETYFGGCKGQSKESILEYIMNDMNTKRTM